MFYIFFGLYIVFVLLPCYVAGSSRIARANDEIGESYDSGIESANPFA